MANRNFFIHNGLTVGSFSVDAATGNLISTGTVTLTTTTNASSTTTGALVVAGGIGVGGNVNVGGNLTVAGTVNATISGSITTATNITGGAAGSIPYQSAAGTTIFRSIGAAGTILQSDGSAPQWVTTASILAGVEVSAATPTVRGTIFGFADSALCNVSLGYNAGNANITGYGNVAIGFQAGLAANIGCNNVGIGHMALFANTSGSNNVGIGFRALCANTTGFQNVGIGFRALYGNTSGVNNIAIGGTALFNNTTGCQNIAIGNLALAANRNGNGNIAIGCSALRNANSPSNNVALGFNAGCALTTGASNVIIGANTGSLIATAQCNIILSDGQGTIRLRINESGATAFDTAGTAFGSAGQLMCSSGNAASPGWVSQSSIAAGSATNLAGGSAGALPYQSGVGTSAFVSGTAGQLLQSAGTSAPTFVGTASLAVGLANNLIGGSTGAVVYQSAGNTTAFVTGTAGQLLQSAGTNAPTFVGTASLAVGLANNLIGGSAGQLVYQSGGNTSAFVGPGTSGQLLVSAGTSAPVYTNTASINVGNATCAVSAQTAGSTSLSTCANNIAAGLAGQIPYQTGANATAFTNAGTTGSFLQANGSGAPTWIATASMSVFNATCAVSAQTAGSAGAATNLAAGLQGSIPFQRSAGTTDFIGIGTAGFFLVSNGTTATWVSTATLGVSSGVSSPATPTQLGLVFGYTTGAGNIAIGCCAGNITQSGTNNFAAGCCVLKSNTLGSNQIGIGNQALASNTTGVCNLALGSGALAANTTGCNNIALGVNAGCDIVNGTSNTIIGNLLGSAALSNTVLIAAGTAEKIKIDNSGFCFNTLPYIRWGSQSIECNILIGGAGNATMTGNVNVGLGCGALCSNTTGIWNTAIGWNALRDNATGISNTAVGNSALLCNRSVWNTAVGQSALQNNVTGSANTAVGLNALGLNISGDSNVAVGFAAIEGQIGGGGNVALGRSAMRRPYCGDNNVAVGNYALYGQATTGTLLNNVAIGACSLRDHVTGCGNIAIGFSALYFTSTATMNLAIGHCAGCCINTGSFNTIIGALPGSSDACNAVLIGSGVTERLRLCSNCFAINGQPGFRALGTTYSWTAGPGFPGSACWNNASIDIPSINSKPGSSTVGWTIDMTATNILRIGWGNVYNAPGLLMGICCNGDITIPSATDTTNSSTGALSVNGGVGIGGCLYVGGGAITGNSGCNLSLSLPASVGTTRCINITGQPGYTVAGPGGTVNVTGGTGQSSTGGLGGAVCILGGNATVGNHNGGNIVLTGGAGVGTGCQGFVRITNTNFAASTETAALAVAGGVGVGGSILAGGQICAARDGFYNWASNGVWASGAGLFTRSISSVISSSGWTIDMTATNVIRIGNASVTGTPTMRFAIYSNGDVCVPGTLVATVGSATCATCATCASFVCTSNSQQINSLGVGTAASGVAGEIRATDNITAYYSSDCRLKSNITPITNAMCKVQQISGVLYDWNDEYIKERGGEDGVFVRKRDVGLIAQEIEKILPEIVVDRENGYKAIKYERVVALLVEAIKELKIDFDNLRNLVVKE